MVSNSFGGRGSGSPLLFITASLQSLAYCNRGVQEMAEYSKGLYNTGIRTCNEAVVTTAYILTVQLSWGVLPYIGYTGMCRWKGYDF